MAVEDALDIFGSDPFGRDYLYGLSTGRDRLGLAPVRYLEEGQDISQGTVKRKGYFGEIPTNNDSMMTEFSSAFEVGGKTVQYPLVVPTLTVDELNLLRLTGEATPEIQKKAQEFALNRLSRGLDPFATTQELRYPQPEGFNPAPRAADRVQESPRGFTSGLFSDVLSGTLNMPSIPRTGIPALDLLSPNMNLLNRLSFGDLQKTAERISYGEPLSTGQGMTLRPKDETVGAALTVAPFAPVVGRVANQAAMTAGRAGARYAERVVPQVMERGGLPAQLLGDVSRGSVSSAVQLGSDFLGKKPPTPEQLSKVSDKFLYHSSTADKANDLLYGIEPQAGGNWVREVAGGAVEGNLDDFFENVTPLSWFSDNPSWIKAMVGRKLNKPFDKVTVDDIEKHGHLAIINKKSPSAQDIYFLPEQGLNDGSQSIVYDIQGNPKKAWQTDLYQEGNYGQRIEPFGTEKNEYVSAKTVEPFIQLTGKDLVDFMKAQGLIENNKIVPSSPTYSDPFGNTIGSSIR